MAIERLTPERRRQLTRDALISAAAQVFTHKGFHAASLDEIAETAGFTRGAIYSNFGSKEELLFAVIDHFEDVRLAGVAEAMEAETNDDDPKSAAVAVAAAVAAGNIWRKLFFRPQELLALNLELRLFALRNPEARKRLAELERQTSDKLTSFIEDEFSRRQIPLHHARELAELGRAAVDGLEQLAAISEDRADYYKHLVSRLFVLLAQAANDPPNEKQDDA